jgi:hypothetical protein
LKIGDYSELRQQEMQVNFAGESPANDNNHDNDIDVVDHETPLVHGSPVFFGKVVQSVNKFYH